MNQAIVKVENLSHRYSVQWAVRDISFEVSTNGIYGLLGANGAGKSTIMNSMCGVLRPSHGGIFIKGIDLLEHPVEAKKHLGFLPQKPPLQLEMTVEEFLTHSAFMRLMEPKDVNRAVEVAMSKCGVEHFRRRLLKNLSGGYQQRVGIAQAIIHDPEFVVLDEPTNGLDPNQILEVRRLIREIAEERTVVLSTHILQEVQALCDHIWMINEGNMVFSGPLQDFDSIMAPNTVVVSLMNTPSLEALEQEAGILRVESLGGVRYRIQLANDQMLAQDFVELSVAKGWQLSEINTEKASLETIFAEFSKKTN